MHVIIHSAYPPNFSVYSNLVSGGYFNPTSASMESIFGCSAGSITGSDNTIDLFHCARYAVSVAN